jgi:large subunit ribosomal protein L3
MILAKKKNMTQIFNEKGIVTPVTILDFSECRIIKGQKKSGNFVAIGTKRKAGKAETGKYGTDNTPEFSIQIENEVENLDELQAGDVLNVTSTSKGKGFAGVMRMWNFKGGKRTHGQSDRMRHPGSIGAGTTTGRVFKGLKMGRRKGGETVTIRNVKVVEIDNENKLLTVAGTIPGTYNSIIKIVKK